MAKLEKGAALMVTVYACDHCGEIAQHPKDVMHVNCAGEGRDEPHPAAAYSRHVVPVFIAHIRK